MNAATKRERLVSSAAELFHRHGIASTSLADIAKHADIPIGNVYYYFKTKEDLALAAVERHRQKLQEVFQKLDEGLDDPRERLIHSLRTFEVLKEDYTKFGCPIGKIVHDSDLQHDNVARAASGTLNLCIDWAEQQFRQLGYGESARHLSISLTAGIQGAGLMAKALNDAQIIAREVERLVAWVSALPNKKIQLGKVGARRPAEEKV